MAWGTTFKSMVYKMNILIWVGTPRGYTHANKNGNKPTPVCVSLSPTLSYYRIIFIFCLNYFFPRLRYIFSKTHQYSSSHCRSCSSCCCAWSSLTRL